MKYFRFIGNKYFKGILLCSLPFIVLFAFVLVPFNINILPKSTIIYDKDGIEIGEIPYQDKYRHREIKFEEIPDFYKKSIVSLEDKSFWYNAGISVSGIIRSTINNLKNGKIVEGGSTISAQFIRNNLWLNESRNFSKKILEFVYAVNLNIFHSKDEIFTRYANQLYFGHLNYGLMSASFYYFNKDVNNLTRAEILALITIQKNSSKYDPYRFKTNFKTRFQLLAKVLQNNGIIDKSDYDGIIAEKLSFNSDHNNKLPYISDFIEHNNKLPFVNIDSIKTQKKISSLSDSSTSFHFAQNDDNDDSNNSKNQNIIQTTIDYDLTKKVEGIGNSAIFELAWKNVKDYGILIIDRKTNKLLTMIGGKNYYSPEGQVNSTLSIRQPGSTMKPFTYVLASKILGIKPNDTILDLPVSYPTKDGYSYEPKNYSTRFEGEVSVGEALAQSMNVPAVKTLESIGVKTLLDFLHNLGIKSLNQTEDYYGLALTLGDGEVTLYELLRAYSIFPNDGQFCNIVFISGANPDCKQVIEKQYTDRINYILSNRYLKIGGYPINSALDFENIDVFFKTGTSRNYRDNWTIGYTPNYVIGVWAGNKDASNMKGVSGATGAGEIFSRIVRYLEKITDKNQIIDTQKNSKPYLQIVAPLQGQKYKLDRFSPQSSQQIKLQFSTNIQYSSITWFLDNSKVNGDFIGLTVGKHILRIELEKDGKKLNESEVWFEVVVE